MPTVEDLAVNNLKPAGALDWNYWDGKQLFRIGNYLGPDDTNLWGIGYEHPEWLTVGPTSGITYDPDFEPVLDETFQPYIGIYVTTPPARFSFVIPYVDTLGQNSIRLVHLSDYLVDGEWDPGIFPKGGPGPPSPGFDCPYERLCNTAYEASTKSRTIDFVGGAVCAYISDFIFGQGAFWTAVGEVSIPGYSTTVPPPQFYGEVNTYFFQPQSLPPFSSLDPSASYTGNPEGGFITYDSVRIEDITVGIDCPQKLGPLPELAIGVFNSQEFGQLHHGSRYSVVFPDDGCPGGTVAPCPDCEPPGGFPIFQGQGAVDFNQSQPSSVPNSLACEGGVCDFIQGTVLASSYYSLNDLPVFDPGNDPPYWCPEDTIVPKGFNGSVFFDNPSQNIYLAATRVQ